MEISSILEEVKKGNMQGYELKGNYVIHTFMGKKISQGKNIWAKKMLKIQLNSIARENLNKAIKILKRLGFEFPNNNGDSFYYTNSKKEQIRISNHQNLSNYHKCPDIQIYSSEKNGYKNIIKNFITNI